MENNPKLQPSNDGKKCLIHRPLFIGYFKPDKNSDWKIVPYEYDRLYDMDKCEKCKEVDEFFKSSNKFKNKDNKELNGK